MPRFWEGRTTPDPDAPRYFRADRKIRCLGCHVVLYLSIEDVLEGRVEMAFGDLGPPQLCPACAGLVRVFGSVR